MNDFYPSLEDYEDCGNCPEEVDITSETGYEFYDDDCDDCDDCEYYDDCDDCEYSWDDYEQPDTWPKIDNSLLARLKRALQGIRYWYRLKTGFYDDIPF